MVSNKLKAEIHRLAESGVSNKEISQKHNIGLRNVQLLTKPVLDRLKQVEAEKMKSWLKRGVKKQDIARRLGISRQALAKRLRKQDALCRNDALRHDGEEKTSHFARCVQCSAKKQLETRMDLLSRMLIHDRQAAVRMLWSFEDSRLVLQIRKYHQQDDEGKMFYEKEAFEHLKDFSRANLCVKCKYTLLKKLSRGLFEKSDMTIQGQYETDLLFLLKYLDKAVYQYGMNLENLNYIISYVFNANGKKIIRALGYWEYCRNDPRKKQFPYLLKHEKSEILMLIENHADLFDIADILKIDVNSIVYYFRNLQWPDGTEIQDACKKDLIRINQPCA